MKFKFLIGWSSALCLSGMRVMAQETNETEALKRQLKQATEAFEKALQENRKVIDALSDRLELLERKNAQNVVATPVAPSAPPDSSTNSSSAAGQSWSPSSPIRVAGAGQNYLNVSFDALAVAGPSTAKDIEAL